MTLVTLQEAKDTLEELMNQAASGEEVIIENADGRTFRIMPIAATKTIPKFGSAKGLIWMADDFDAPLADFEK